MAKTKHPTPPSPAWFGSSIQHLDSSDFKRFDTHPAISHELQILTPLLESLLLPAGSFQPQSATDVLDRDGHHLRNREIKLISELTPIRQIED
ncbi:hypothetical protein [Pseudomonas sp. Root562]|uniref:hypothetical protein n=1 Tax=Pseudomonas sp. Root562 TaxID=1736561 RepID=UPI0012E34B9C|nr:hypothetical protein [Pseudomonas sp. Root562]